MFREERENEKKAICLHFTAGWDHVGPDTSASTNNSVNYYVHREGTIVELGEPELWSRNSSVGPRNRHVIAIEIVNIGYLEYDSNNSLRNYTGDIYCDIDNSLEGHGKAYIDLENNPYDPKGIYPEGSYRGYRYYAAWTTDQIRSVKKLLKALCAAYDIPYKFLPPEYRFKYFPSLGNYIPTDPSMQKWCYDGPEIKYEDGFKWLEENGIGIISHVNTALVSREIRGVRPTSHSAISKWDIGPAFDWNYLENTLQTAYPYQSPASALKEPNPLHWFDNPELRRQGGYFPIGANGAAHAGMHLFDPSPNSQAVSAMADGSVVAFRFYSAEQRRGQEENRPEELRNLANPTHSGFVLLKHDFSLTGREDDDVKSFYSLYMDLQPPSEGTTVPWVEHLRELAKGCSLSLEYDNLGLPVAKGTPGAHERPPMNVLANLDFADSVPVHKSNEHGVISFSEPWLTVGGKETIGYTSSLGGEDNYCHWEVFATGKDVITGLANLLGDQNDGGDFSFEELGEAEDGIFSADELNSLLDPEENRFEKPFLTWGLSNLRRMAGIFP